MQQPEAKTWHESHRATRTLGARVADAVASGMGSWTFIILQTIFVAIWVTLNIIGFVAHWDAWPFILLNLIFSTQAAYAAPIIMMAQNRQTERDRHHAEADYKTNRQAKQEIEDLQIRLNRIETDKLDKILALLQKQP